MFTRLRNDDSLMNWVQFLSSCLWWFNTDGTRANSATSRTTLSKIFASGCSFLRPKYWSLDIIIIYYKLTFGICRFFLAVAVTLGTSSCQRLGVQQIPDSPKKNSIWSWRGIHTIHRSPVGLPFIQNIFVTSPSAAAHLLLIGLIPFSFSW